MPTAGISLISHQDILTYEEIHAIVQAASELGISKVRLTGGEPLSRLDLPKLVAMIKEIATIDDIALTTNGTLLSRYVTELKQAGLSRVNVSLDTLKPARFRQITRSHYKLSDVLAGINATRSAGLNPVKINVVAIAGVNDDEVLDFARKTIDDDWHVRFIEFMPTPGVTGTEFHFVPIAEIKKRLEQLGELIPCLSHVGNGPAKYFRLENGRGSIGFIGPLSEHFCFKCNRLRLTANGKLLPCLMSGEEIDLREPLRSGISKACLKALIKKAVAQKPLRHRLAEGQQSEGRPMTQVGG
jgi:cyclic pyranopterin phosphate synthase